MFWSSTYLRFILSKFKFMQTNKTWKSIPFQWIKGSFSCNYSFPNWINLIMNFFCGGIASYKLYTVCYVWCYTHKNHGMEKLAYCIAPQNNSLVFILDLPLHARLIQGIRKVQLWQDLMSAGQIHVRLVAWILILITRPWWNEVIV